MSKATSMTLGALLLAMSVGAISAGVGMINGGIGIPDDWLARTPFDDWTMPGVALISVVGIPQLLALNALVFRWRELRALTFIAAVLLAGWIVVEVVWMWHFNFLQPICFAVAAVQLAIVHRSRTATAGATPAFH